MYYCCALSHLSGFSKPSMKQLVAYSFPPQSLCRYSRFILWAEASRRPESPWVPRRIKLGACGPVVSSNTVGEDKQGLVQGVIASLSSIAAFLAPLVATGIFESFVDDTGIYLPGAPFLMGGILIVLMIPLIFRLRVWAQS